MRIMSCARDDVAGGRAPRSARGGAGTVTARVANGRTVLAAVRADSPLRLIQPTFPGTSGAAAVCIVTFGGGLVDGDAIELDLVVEAGATLVLFTQSSTKVFRGSSSQRLSAKVEGTLVFLPDPVSAFAGARYTQRVDVALGAAGACVLLDGFTSGRAAFGERWAMRALDLRTTITRVGDGIVTDALLLDTADGSIAERMGRFDAVATLIAVGHAAEPVARAIRREPIAPPVAELVVAASPLPRALGLGVPGAIARVAASSPAGALQAVRSRLRNLPDLDAVDPFACRY
jgi:urease accessory protein